MFVYMSCFSHFINSECVLQKCKLLEVNGTFNTTKICVWFVSTQLCPLSYWDLIGAQRQYGVKLRKAQLYANVTWRDARANLACFDCHRNRSICIKTVSTTWAVSKTNCKQSFSILEKQTCDRKLTISCVYYRGFVRKELSNRGKASILVDISMLHTWASSRQNE